MHEFLCRYSIGSARLAVDDHHDVPRSPPTDELGYLLGKHPDRVHRADLGYGTATVCFPQADRTGAPPR